MLTLYQAEWCPFSSAVREILTELGLDFVARQVEPWPEQRRALAELTGSTRIPTLETADGRFFRGTRAIYGYLREQDPWAHADEHRRRFLDHRAAREADAAGQLVDYFRPPEEAAVAASPGEAEVVDVPEKSRYELRLGDRMVGEVAYHRRNGRITFLHTEVDESLEGRGFGSRLAAAALADARRQGLEVLPLCPFISHYVGTHPEEQDLVPENYRRRAAVS
jgi:hypothetical protein